MKSLVLDHERYLASMAYRREVHAQLRRLLTDQARAVSEMTIVHEADNACCRREAWPLTYSHLLAALAADGERVLGVVL